MALLDGRPVQRAVARDVRVLELRRYSTRDLYVVVRELCDSANTATVAATVVGVVDTVNELLHG